MTRAKSYPVGAVASATSSWDDFPEKWHGRITVRATKSLNPNAWHPIWRCDHDHTTSKEAQECAERELAAHA